MELCLIGICNFVITGYDSQRAQKEYLVDVSRAAQDMREGTSAKDLDMGKYNSLLSVQIFDPDEVCNEEYRIEDIDGTWYRFCYRENQGSHTVTMMNGMLMVMWLISAFVLYMMGKKVVAPFNTCLLYTSDAADEL